MKIMEFKIYLLYMDTFLYIYTYGLKIYIEDTVICDNGSGMFCARSPDLL